MSGWRRNPKVFPKLLSLLFGNYLLYLVAFDIPRETLYLRRMLNNRSDVPKTAMFSTINDK